MLFSSPVFLFYFLPVTLLGYYLCPRILKNYWLLFCSLVFFAWGGITYTLILLGSIILNYFIGLLIEKHKNTGLAYKWTFAGVAINLLILGLFKYTNFIVHNFNELLSFVSIQIPLIKQTHIALPIGISFYTFHSLSYLVDIYKGKTSAQRNIFNLSLYISMFSQLVAGPIVRYSDVWQQLTNRSHTFTKFASGVERFLIGLAKKVLLANTFACVADNIFGKNPESLGCMNAWLGIVCYTMQIYCDFAGYSDMAIGLGRMFGFEFLENFNFPYLAKSVKEFWRRWHISLSTFFRDYVYIPLGGNRVNIGRQYFNLITVFFLTGLWHGASWNFLVWGLFHGFFMLLERLGFEKLLEKTWSPFAHLYTLLVVLFAWVLFRADNLTYGVDYWKAMLSFKNTTNQLADFWYQIDIHFILCLAVFLSGSFGLFEKLKKIIEQIIQKDSLSSKLAAYTYHTASIVFYGGVLILSTMYLLANTYNPFIYYRF